MSKKLPSLSRLPQYFNESSSEIEILKKVLQQYIESKFTVQICANDPQKLQISVTKGVINNLKSQS